MPRLKKPSRRATKHPARSIRTSEDFYYTRKYRLERYIVNELHRYMRINKRNEKDLKYIG